MTMYYRSRREDEDEDEEEERTKTTIGCFTSQVEVNIVNVTSCHRDSVTA